MTLMGRNDPYLVKGEATMKRLTNTPSLLAALLLSGWMTLAPMGCARQPGQPQGDFGKGQSFSSLPAAFADGTLSASQRAQIDSAAASVLAGTGAPSASIAVVWDGRIVYERAYGSARLTPPTPAASTMRYSIGSISKQFTAAAVLLLAEEGRLSLDDKVGKWLPDLTRANDVSIRQLLSMAPGLRLPGPARAHDAAGHPGSVGPQAARFRARDEVAVQQYELRHRRSDRGAGERRASGRLPAEARVRAAWHGFRSGH
jgi:CubicO group peptidase (beta-lactamase class C family)